MNRLTLGLAVMLAASCGGSSGTRYFRVLFPSQLGAAQPDSCYQAQSIAPAMTPEQSAAQAFCMVGKKPSAGSSSTNNLFTASSWTMVDTGDSKLYLLINTGGAAASGAEGSLNAGTYAFDLNNTTARKDCPTGGAGVIECNGQCVNTRSDKNNCGSCGFPCSGTDVCRGSVCQTSCNPVMQTCGGNMVDTTSDNNNCGICGRVCASPQVCSGSICVETACVATCSNKYDQASCGSPRTFTRSQDSKISFELSGGALKGQLATNSSYQCAAPGCATDFDARCPACATTQTFTGREVSNVTEFEQR